jgi:hypothetical protein
VPLSLVFSATPSAVECSKKYSYKLQALSCKQIQLKVESYSTAALRTAKPKPLIGNIKQQNS